MQGRDATEGSGRRGGVGEAAREAPARRTGSDGPHWRSPQVLLPLFALVVTGVYAIRSGPPPRPPAPALSLRPEEAPAAPPTETVLYAVDADGLARPIVRELPAPEDPSARLQGLVDALREAMIETGAWPEALPAPAVFAFTQGRDDVAVLDLPENDARLGVAGEGAILASLERTLMEAGVDRIAYLRGGRAAPAWLGSLAAPNALD